MNKVKVWDAGADKGDERYTVLASKYAYIVGESTETPGFVDVKNIQVLPIGQIDEKSMDSLYPTINPKDLPEVIKNAVKERAKNV